jgi:hypothetical protein
VHQRRPHRAYRQKSLDPSGTLFSNSVFQAADSTACSLPAKTNVVPLGMEARLQFEAPTMITPARQLVEKRFVWDQSTHQNFRTSWQTRVTVKSKRRPRLTEAAISSPSLARFSSRDSSVPRTDC